MAETEELKRFLMKVTEESEKVCLKLNIQKTKIIASGPITSWQIDGETMETVTYFNLGDSKITVDGDYSHEIPWKKSYDLGEGGGRGDRDGEDMWTQGLFISMYDKIHYKKKKKKQRHYFANKGPSIQSHGFSSSHVWMWELVYKESWAPKNRCFWTVVLEKTLESPLDCKEIQPVHPKENQSWIFIGRTDVEAEAPILWPHDVKN